MIEYSATPLTFKARKVLRYTRLYGPSRTLAKVQGQRHMQRTHVKPSPAGAAGQGHVGLIGAGNYAYTTIAHYVDQAEPGAIRAVMDVDSARAGSLADKYGASYSTTDARTLLDDPTIDLIYIASNHASHADYAVEALRAGKAVHVEKPHAVTREQLSTLCEAMTDTGRPLAIGYNRPDSRLGVELRRHLDQQQGAGMYNWFVAGHELSDDHWYYAEAEGGRVLGNMCHWIDFLFRLVAPEDRYPIRVSPSVATRSDCDVVVTYTFGDGTIGVISFSAKGHAFEGVREHFSGQRGNVLASLRDFQSLDIDDGATKHRYRNMFRDHGHSRRIRRSLAMVSDPSLGDSAEYVQQTGQLMLETRRALQAGSDVSVDEPGRLAVPAGL